MMVAEEEVMQIVSSCFQRALSVGFQRDVIRLQSILTSFPNITDNGLLKKVNAIMAMDKENGEKTGKSVAVNLLNVWHGEIPHFPQRNVLRRIEYEHQHDRAGQEQEGRNGRDAGENKEFGDEDRWWWFGR